MLKHNIKSCKQYDRKADVQCLYGMFSPNGIDQKRARKGLAQPQAWHTGDVSASHKQGKAYELAGVTRERQLKPGL
jgi:hypothetical protein